MVVTMAPFGWMTSITMLRTKMPTFCVLLSSLSFSQDVPKQINLCTTTVIALCKKLPFLCFACFYSCFQTVRELQFVSCSPSSYYSMSNVQMSRFILQESIYTTTSRSVDHNEIIIFRNNNHVFRCTSMLTTLSICTWRSSSLWFLDIIAIVIIMIVFIQGSFHRVFLSNNLGYQGINGFDYRNAGPITTASSISALITTLRKLMWCTMENLLLL